MNNKPGLAKILAANRERSIRTAAVRTAKIRDALDILGRRCPRRYAKVAMVCLDNPALHSLRDLAAAADPPMTKDTFAALLRRFLLLAEEVRTQRAEPSD